VDIVAFSLSGSSLSFVHSESDKILVCSVCKFVYVIMICLEVYMWLMPNLRRFQFGESKGLSINNVVNFMRENPVIPIPVIFVAN
jgi:hypothetical protein